MDLYFKTTILSFIAFETRKQSLTCLLSRQHISACRTVPHSWNTFNLRKWDDLRNSLAVILPLYICYRFQVLYQLLKYVDIYEYYFGITTTTTTTTTRAAAVYNLRLFYLINMQAVRFFEFEISTWKNSTSQEHKVNI